MKYVFIKSVIGNKQTNDADTAIPKIGEIRDPFFIFIH